MYKVKMVKKNKSSTITKEFNGHEVHTRKINKKGIVLKERWECLWKYSKSIPGYQHQLELMGFVKE